MGLFRALGRMIMKRGVRKGFSGRKIIRQVRKWGSGYKDSVMWRDIRQLKGVQKYETRIGKMPGGDKIPRAWMSEIDLKQFKKYRVYGDTTYYSDITHKFETKRTSLYTDRQLTNDELEQEYIEKSLGRQYKQNAKVVKFKVRAIEHNAGFSY